MRRIGVLVVVLLLWLTWSIGGALTAPGTDTTAARLAEWGRFHGLGWAVTSLEEVQYKANPPKVGGSVAAGDASADLGRVGFVLHLLQTGDRPAEPVEPAPLGQSRGRCVGPRRCQGTTDRPGEPKQQDHHQHAYPAHPETTPSRPGHCPFWRLPVLVRVFDLQVASCCQLNVPP